ncbi:glutamate receptor 1 [Drosophila novamexicana]|uniref:glutamate receptor 1 n=1 Tax=Drosophila novamexicana TaxID=47314 RepID=UPI0011E5B107|nr:glutamate receptor 1 [Drosophila novamexicana]
MIKLQVKIILWIFIISATFLCGAQIENINSNELLAFEDFLRAQHLKHALLLGPEPGPGPNWSRQIENYKRLFANYRMQFFTPQRGVQFQELFYYEAPRTAVLVAAFEGEHVKRWVYEAASAGGYFNNSQAWFMLGKCQANRTDEQIIRLHLSAYNISIDADITVAMRVPQTTSRLLYDVYRVGQDTPLRVEPKGQWSPAAGYKLWDNFSGSWLRRRSNLGNITLIGSTALIEKPAGMDDLSYLSNNKDLLQLDPMQRKTFQLFLLMGRMYNLSLEVRFRETWGQLLPNGSWTGVMGHVTSGEVHFAVCPIRFVTERHRYIQYTPALHTQLIHFLFRHPRHSSIRNIFFEPLSTQVWWCVLALVVGSGMLLLLHVRQELRLQQQQQHLAQPVERQMSFVWFTMLETFLQQGPSTGQFQLPSTKILISASCIFSFMLMQFYGAFIVGSLLSDTPRSIVNLQALYESTLEIGMEDIAYNYELFTNTTNQLVRNVYSKRICRDRQHNILSIEEGAKRIKHGGFAFHTAIDRLYRLLNELLDERLFCELQEIMFSPPYLGASVLPKSSPWREHLNHAVLYLGETGLIGYNDKMWTVPRPDCTLFKDAEVEVDLKHFAPALFTLVLAMLVSSTVFLLELLLDWLKARAKATAGWREKGQFLNL